MALVLVVSPHPDDEAIGMGGTIRRRVDEGDRVEVLFLTSGERGGHGRPPDETARLREAEAAAAAEMLGVAGVEFWREPDSALAATEDVVDRLCRAVSLRRPDVIYTTHPGEQHPDHAAAAAIVARAAASLPDPLAVPALLAFEVWTPLAEMDEIVDISEQMAIKLAAIRVYRSQVDVLRFDEAFEGLARYRGEMHSWPGGPYAEVFRRLSPSSSPEAGR